MNIHKTNGILLLVGSVIVIFMTGFSAGRGYEHRRIFKVLRYLYRHPDYMHSLISVDNFKPVPKGYEPAKMILDIVGEHSGDGED